MNSLEKQIRDQKFISKLPSYTPLAIILRLTITSLIAIIDIKLIMQIVEVPGLPGPELKDYLIIIFGFNLLSESNIFMDHVLERFLPVPEKIKLRFTVQTFISILLIFSVHHLIKWFVPDIENIGKAAFYVAVASGLVLTTFIVFILFVIRMMDKWVYAQQHIEEMKREKLKMDYNTLQDQLNPHFLFNNLSVLKSLIIYDQKTAVSFTQNFTDVYRYVLKSRDKMLVELKDELKFIDSYIALHKERLGNGIDVQFMIDKSGVEKNIAPLSLQLLVENAIKHNIVSKEHPLLLEISSDENYLIVKNNLQLKESSYSTKTGLSNLIKRYELLEGGNIKVEQTDDYFKVKVPLL